MKSTILKNYKGMIDSIEEKLSQEDKTTLDDYLRKRRTKAGDEKVKSYRVKILILRDVAQKSFKNFNDKKLIDDLLILIKNCDREDTEKIELRKILKHFLKWKFNDMDLIKEIKSKLKSESDINRTKINKNNFPTDEEVKKMFLACQNLKEKAMLTTQDELGLRPMELLNLKWGNITIEYNGAIFQINGTKCINAVRTLPLKFALLHLKRWKNEYPFEDLREDDYVFPNQDRDKPLNPKYLSGLYRQLCKRAGIRNITPYMLRHRRLTYIYEKTQDLKLTARYGGHSLEVSEKFYQHSTDNDIKNMIMSKVYDVKEPTAEEKTEIEVLQKELKDFKENQNLILEILKGSELTKAVFEAVLSKKLEAGEIS